MQGAKQKVKDMASAAKQHAQIYEAKVEEKAEKAGARTEEGKQLARERRKVKEAEAKAELHASKARHVEEKLEAKQQPLHIPGVGAGHHHVTPGAAGAQYGYPETGHVGMDPLHPVGTHHVPGAAPYTTDTEHHHVTPGAAGAQYGYPETGHVDMDPLHPVGTHHVTGAAPYTTSDTAHHHVTGRRLL